MAEIREIAWGSGEYRASLALRDRILRKPLGLDLYAEELSGEAGDLHLGAFAEGRLIGVLILTPKTPQRLKMPQHLKTSQHLKTPQGVGAPEQARMRQVAVAPEFRGSGVGRLLVRRAEEEAERRGFSGLVLDARKTAEGFYLRLGYETVSGEFTEATIPHVRMRRAIR